MRIRTVKPEFFLHEELFRAERESRLPLRVAFVGLWCAADREGRFAWEPGRLKAQILPYDRVDFSRVLDVLAERGFIIRYESSAEDLRQTCGTSAALLRRFCGVIPTFLRHQVINNKERASDLPSPPQIVVKVTSQTPNDQHSEFDACLTRASRVPHAYSESLFLDRVEGNKEGNKEQGKEHDVRTDGTCASTVVAAPRARMTPPSIEEAKTYAAEISLPTAEADRFFDYYGSNGWRVGRNPMKDWRSAMRNWQRKFNADQGLAQRVSAVRIPASAQRNNSMEVDPVEHGKMIMAALRASGEVKDI